MEKSFHFFRELFPHSQVINGHTVIVNRNTYKTIEFNDIVWIEKTYLSSETETDLVTSWIGNRKTGGNIKFPVRTLPATFDYAN